MDRIRLKQILNVLLLPYREASFSLFENDIIIQIRYTFAKLQDREQLFNIQKIEREENYNKAEKNLKNYLKDHTELNFTKIDDFKMLLNLFFSEQEITQIYMKFIKMGKDDPLAIDIFYLKNLFSIAKSLLTFRDGRIAIRTWNNSVDEKEEDIFNYPNVFDKVETWNMISRMMTPDIFIAAFFQAAGLEQEFYLYNQSGNISLADKTLEKILKKGISETHFHFNAGIQYIYFWQQSTNVMLWENAFHSIQDYQKCKNKFCCSFESVLFRMIWAEFLEMDTRKSLIEFVYYRYAEAASGIVGLLNDYYNGKIKKFIDNGNQLYRTIVKKWEELYSISEDGDFLMGSVYKQYKTYRTYSEMIFLFKSLKYFKNHPNNISDIHLFLQYLRAKNSYFSLIIQSNQIEGLDNFQLFYNHMGQHLWSLWKYKERFRILFKSICSINHLKKLEIRIAPDLKLYADKEYYSYQVVQYEIKRDILKCIFNILEAYKDNMEQTVTKGHYHLDKKTMLNEMDHIVMEGKESIPSIGIIFHFLKADFVDNRIGDMCWVKEKHKESVHFSKHLIIWRRSMVEYAKMIEKLRSKIPLLDKYIVGIDAASAENDTQPWIFAPVYAAIRNKYITMPVYKGENNEIKRINNIGFTYHVGEEFRHVLSGLRHIDEVINHFHYKSGDRLGHAIALGVNIASWVEKNEVIVIPVIEQMENLLWIWGNMVYYNWDLDVSMEVIEGKILDLAKSVYGEILGLTVFMLYEAYIEKFRLNYEEIFYKMHYYINEQTETNVQDNNINHFCKIYNPNNPYGLLWTKEKIFCTFFCPYFYQKYQKPLFVHVEKNEYNMLKTIQEYVLKEIEQRGIYIEVNPTSNTVIGTENGLYKSHILNLNSRGLTSEDNIKHEVLVTINSDDPLIFNTNCENELAYIYHALIYKGYKKESVLNWIDEVRQMGVDSSFIKEYCKPSVQYEEIEKILQEIEKVLKSAEL